MGARLTVGLTVVASLAVTGCAGVPVAVTAASLYVDAVLLLRTNKTATDHIISAAVDRDCAVLNVLAKGRLCDDAPPPDLLAELMREVENEPIAIAGADERIEVAEAAPLVLSDSVPTGGAAQLTAPLLPEAPPLAAGTPPRPYQVVVASYTRQAHAQRAARAHPDAEIIEATVYGQRYYRLVVRTPDRDTAALRLARLEADGVRGAWLRPESAIPPAR